MAYPYTHKLIYPLKKHHISRPFLKHCQYRETTKGNWVDWGQHLGEDYNVPANTPIYAIGRGKVVYSKFHPGLNAGKRNWGNIIIIAHKDSRTKRIFYSLYGHLRDRLVKKGDKIEISQKIGVIAKENTPENGWWGKAHLHFAIYIGPWKEKILPGYFQLDSKLTKLIYWTNPSLFIKKYNVNNNL